MNGDSIVSGADDSSGYYRRCYNLRSANTPGKPESAAAAGVAAADTGRTLTYAVGRPCTAALAALVYGRPGHREKTSGGGGGGGGGFFEPRGPWSARGDVGGRGDRDEAVPRPRTAAAFLARLAVTVALATALVLSLGMSGMYVDIRALHGQLADLSAAVDGLASKMAEIKRTQEALYGRLYEHVNRAQETLRADVEALLRRELWLRDNDKTGLVDFALESAGGRVVSTNGTPRYDAEDSTLRFLGIPLYQFTRSNPAAMLQPDMSPGSCWAFRGSRGVAVVSLLGFVHVSAVSLEHIPASQAPTGPTRSAPRDFAVLALPGPALDDAAAVELGRFVYRADGRALQIFRVTARPGRSHRYVALRIDSNHGHPDFTCVYRFRVHGSLDHGGEQRGLQGGQGDPGARGVAG